MIRIRRPQRRSRITGDLGTRFVRADGSQSHILIARGLRKLQVQPKQQSQHATTISNMLWLRYSQKTAYGSRRGFRSWERDGGVGIVISKVGIVPVLQHEDALQSL